MNERSKLNCKVLKKRLPWEKLLKENILAAVKYYSIYRLNLKLKVTVESSSQTSICFPSMKPYGLCLTPVCLLGVYLFLNSLQKNSHKHGKFFVSCKNHFTVKKSSWFIILICQVSTVSFPILIILPYARLYRTLIPSMIPVWIHLQQLKHQFAF